MYISWQSRRAEQIQQEERPLMGGTLGLQMPFLSCLIDEAKKLSAGSLWVIYAHNERILARIFCLGFDWSFWADN